MPKLSIVRGGSRKENIIKAIRLIEKDVDKTIEAKKSDQLFIKINAIDSNFPLACTHADALDAVLDAFYDRFSEVIVGDNTFVFYKNKGGPYEMVLKKFPKVRFSDLTEFDSEDITFRKLGGLKSIARISLLPRKAFTISLALPKTHDTFVYTGCLKNMFGCVIRNRGGLHAVSAYESIFNSRYVRSNEIKWHNLASVINKAMPDLCVLDAFEGMEGDGPIIGDAVIMETAMCSVDGIALDKLASKIYGFDHVPYLSMLPDKSKVKDVEIIREGFKNLSEISRNFRKHYKYKYQIMSPKQITIPALDIKFALAFLKRPHRIRDKALEKIRNVVVNL
jgi:uncharacterized protein (DUF362 family)